MLFRASWLFGLSVENFKNQIDQTNQTTRQTGLIP